jgi:glycosyltransferase involved in cell wall biosynthesis
MSFIEKPMKTSILIIAYNEELHIRECIESILNQSQKTDEIILIAHNCTDNILNITQEYPTIQVYELKTDEK